MIDLKHFRFRASSRFFKRKYIDGTAIAISKSYIDRVFEKLAKGREGNFVHYEVCVNEKVGSENIRYSLAVFVKKNSPQFLDRKANKIDIVYAYVLLVEFSDILVVNATNVMFGPRNFRDVAEEIDHDTVSKCLVDSKTVIEGMDTENMDASDSAIRRRKISAINLSNSYTPPTAGRQLIGNLRLNRANRIFSVNTTTGRMYETTGAKSLNDFLKWSWEVVYNIRTYKRKQGYLDNFAKSLSFTELNVGRKPNSVLITLDRLLDSEEEMLEVDKCEYIAGDDVELITLGQLSEMFNRVYRLVVNPTSGKMLLRHPDDPDEITLTDRSTLMDKIRSNIYLRRNSASYSIFSPELSRVLLTLTNGTQITLGNFITSRKAFQVTFDDPTTVYWKGRPFSDPGILGRLEGFMSTFVESSGISKVIDEKGESRIGTKSKFPVDSMFGQIETEKDLGADADFLVCDDFGDEWADYIAIKTNKYIRFIHAKHNNEGMSATAFQDVVMQGTKNIGNMTNVLELSRKVKTWRSNWGKTKIKRLRKGKDLKSFEAAFRTTINNAAADKEVYLAVSFISKSKLEDGLKLFGERKSKEYQLQQLFWIITSFISVCQDAGVKARIVCKK